MTLYRQAGFAQEISAWRSALANLPENPVARYMMLMIRRRRGYQPFHRKLLLVGWPVLLFCVLSLLLKWFNGFGIAMLEGAHALVFMFACMGAALVLCVVILLELLVFTTMAFGLLAGVTVRQVNRAGLDNLLSATILTDHDIAAGVLRVLAPRLWMLSAAGSFAFWFLPAAIMGIDWIPSNIMTLLAGAGASAITGMLAGIILLCWLLVTGRNTVNPLLGSLAGLLVCLGQMAHLWVAGPVLDLYQTMMCPGNFSLFMPEQFRNLIVAIIAMTFLYWLMLACSNRRPVSGRVLSLAVPATLVLGMVSVLLVYKQPAFQGIKASMIVVSGWLGCVSVFSPVSAAAASLIDVNSLPMEHVVPGGWLLLPAVVLQQLVLLVTGLSAVRSAVTMWRMGAD